MEKIQIALLCLLTATANSFGFGSYWKRFCWNSLRTMRTSLKTRLLAGVTTTGLLPAYLRDHEFSDANDKSKSGVYEVSVAEKDFRSACTAKLAPLFLIHKCSKKEQENCLTEFHRIISVTPSHEKSPLDGTNEQPRRLCNQLNIELARRTSLTNLDLIDSHLGTYRHLKRPCNPNKLYGLLSDFDFFYVHRIKDMLERNNVKAGYLFADGRDIITLQEQLLHESCWARDRAKNIPATIPVVVDSSVSNEEVVDAIKRAIK